MNPWDLASILIDQPQNIVEEAIKDYWSPDGVRSWLKSYDLDELDTRSFLRKISKSKKNARRSIKILRTN